MKPFYWKLLFLYICFPCELSSFVKIESNCVLGALLLKWKLKGVGVLSTHVTCLTRQYLFWLFLISPISVVFTFPPYRGRWKRFLEFRLVKIGCIFCHVFNHENAITHYLTTQGSKCLHSYIKLDFNFILKWMLQGTWLGASPEGSQVNVFS